MKKKTSTLLVAITLALVSVIPNGRTESPSAWENWRPLLGTWQAEGKGAPGQGIGTFSFTTELQNRIIIRKSHTDYPAAEGRAAFSHDDVMIVYRENDKTRADYFDNEGHVIRYTAEVSPDNRSIVFLSDLQPSQPVFRLTYALADQGKVLIKFEIAPPNAPNDFTVYVQGSAHKA